MLLEKLWNNFPKKEIPDTELVVEMGENSVTFQCHKIVLSEASQVFQQKCSNIENNTITITNTKPSTVFLMLCYIYNGDFNPCSIETTEDLLLAASTYEITSLFETCIEFLMDILDLSNACSLLELAITHSIPKLYVKSLLICVNAAFIILDSEDFDHIKSSTIIVIISQPQLNVNAESEIIYSLWMRATIDANRYRTDPTYDDILHFFEPYSSYINYEDVAEDDINAYKNEYLSKYLRMKAVKANKKGNKRKIRMPLSLPSILFYVYQVEDIENVITLTSDELQNKFTLSNNCYLCELTIAYCLVSNLPEESVSSVSLKNENGVLIKWDKRENTSVAGVYAQEKTIQTPHGPLWFKEFQFTFFNLIKLTNSNVYTLKFESSYDDLLWPMFEVKEDDLVKMKSSCIIGLTSIKLLPYH